MNVQEAWADGVTGNGSVVSILDDGLEINHPDIFRNYVCTRLHCCSRYSARFVKRLTFFPQGSNG